MRLRNSGSSLLSVLPGAHALVDMPRPPRFPPIERSQILNSCWEEAKQEVSARIIYPERGVAASARLKLGPQDMFEERLGKKDAPYEGRSLRSGVPGGARYTLYQSTLFAGM